jgi:hypothetical protein
MGLGSTDPTVEGYAREVTEAYTVCFLRDLMRANETNGKIEPGTSAPVSFIVAKVPTFAGTPGEDYNRIEIGGAWQAGDPRDASEPLFWGYAPIDTGNTQREDLSVDVPDGLGGTTHLGLGARTRVLDPGSANADPSWVTATAPLRSSPLGADDGKYFLPGFVPASQNQAVRYRDIVNQITRASREIAAIVAHHIGRATGLPAGGNGPMANPSVAGNLWPVSGALAFDQADLATLMASAVANQLPGNSGVLGINYFPLLSTQPSVLPPSTAAVDYSVNWNFVGGRPNAVPDADYRVKNKSVLDYGGVLTSVRGTFAVDFTGLRVTNSPVYIDSAIGLPYAGIAFFRVSVTDVVRDKTVTFLYRLNVMPNFTLLPTSGPAFIRANQLAKYIANN